MIDIDLSWNVSDESVTSCLEALCSANEESQLRSIQLRGSAVQFESVKKLLQSCPNLETIDLQSCRGLPRGIKRAYAASEFFKLKEEIIDGRYD